MGGLKKSSRYSEEWVIEYAGREFPLAALTKLLNVVFIVVIFGFGYNFGQYTMIEMQKATIYNCGGVLNESSGMFVECPLKLGENGLYYDCKEVTSEYQTPLYNLNYT
jgi:hypothetical protein